MEIYRRCKGIYGMSGNHGWKFTDDVKGFTVCQEIMDGNLPTM
ncbi:hypothetical protein [Thalassotalea mangrovi]|nr:hypothetical protein [Thalassotalea mangrovi]